MTNFKYTKDEEEILDYIENKKPKSIPNLQKEIAKYQKIAKEQYGKRKAISIFFCFRIGN